jgi:NAD(P)-dependent dehydrogenase (short-subunit alcohol dehydrogenase family)
VRVNTVSPGMTQVCRPPLAAVDAAVGCRFIAQRVHGDSQAAKVFTLLLDLILSPLTAPLPDPLTQTDLITDAMVERALPSIPMGRAGQPHEVASAIVWLLSDEAAYVSGANLRVAGGRP